MVLIWQILGYGTKTIVDKRKTKKRKKKKKRKIIYPQNKRQHPECDKIFANNIRDYYPDYIKDT